MANYYTTRFNPAFWPPANGAIPAGVIQDAENLLAERSACCERAELIASTATPGEPPWSYQAAYLWNCPVHGETRSETERILDWITPNEYLLP